MERYGSIYIITNTVNKKQYVGQTTGKVLDRFKEHISEKRNRHISNAIRTYGPDKFVIEEILTCLDKNSLNDMETYYVEKLNSMHPNGYNHRSGGNQNGKCSEELKLKISKAKNGKPNFKKRGEERSPEYREKISRSLGGQRIIAIHKESKQIKIYNTVNETREDGFNPSNVVSVCKKKRLHSKNWIFYYESEYANQSGSEETKNSSHAQRLDSEPSKEE